MKAILKAHKWLVLAVALCSGTEILDASPITSLLLSEVPVVAASTPKVPPTIPKCGAAAKSPKKQESPGVKQDTIRVGLDRRSFLNRGYTASQLGAWNNGDVVGKRGVFLSMFYALQLNHPDDPHHAWNESVTDKYRGLSAFLDEMVKQELGKKRGLTIQIFDNREEKNLDLIVVGRRGNEAPFDSDKECKDGIGCAWPGSREIFVRTDYPWNLGHRMDKPFWSLSGTTMRVNLTHIIAHEMGHFLGLPHTADDGSVMYSGGNDAEYQIWLAPEKEIKALFKKLVQLIFE